MEAQERYGIGKVCEFYGATEGAGALINTDGRVGAVGFYSALVDFVLKVRVCVCACVCAIMCMS
jgi:hypothetical protein